jgi:hypothetical protein
VGRPLIAGIVALVTGAAGSAFSVPCESSTAVAAAYNLKAYPLASFVWCPAFPRPGESISLVSTSTDLTSPITAYAWDLADNGPFGAFKDGGPVTTTTFATPASHQARLRVTAADHLSSIAVETIHMSTPPHAGEVSGHGRRSPWTALPGDRPGGGVLARPSRPARRRKDKPRIRRTTGAKALRGHLVSHPAPRAAACRCAMPSRRACDSATMAGLRTALQIVIGAPPESLTAGRCEHRTRASAAR